MTTVKAPGLGGFIVVTLHATFCHASHVSAQKPERIKVAKPHYQADLRKAQSTQAPKTAANLHPAKNAALPSEAQANSPPNLPQHKKSTATSQSGKSQCSSNSFNQFLLDLPLPPFPRKRVLMPRLSGLPLLQSSTCVRLPLNSGRYCQAQ